MAQQKTCTKCGETKPLDQFPRAARNRDGIDSWCRACHTEASRHHRQANRARTNEATRRWRQENPERQREASRQWRDENLERCREVDRERNQKNRAAVFDHYGWSCACCGTADAPAIDHVNGGGEAHRRELGTKGGSGMYNWLIRSGFPEGYQTLCQPRNNSKRDGDRCRLDHAAA
jgi:hypothetical protein